MQQLQEVAYLQSRRDEYRFCHDFADRMLRNAAVRVKILMMNYADDVIYRFFVNGQTRMSGFGKNLCNFVF